jgi:hypothetical protein
MKTTLMLLLIAAATLAQEAKVVQLSKADAERAKASYDAMKKAEADWQAVQADIEHGYVSDAREVEEGQLSSTLMLATAHLLSATEPNSTVPRPMLCLSFTLTVSTALTRWTPIAWTAKSGKRRRPNWPAPKPNGRMRSGARSCPRKPSTRRRMAGITDSRSVPTFSSSCPSLNQ